jgi:SAM-dependent methyltransferase
MIYISVQMARLTPAEVRRGKAEIEAAGGPWTAHNCQLSQDVWTLREGTVNFDEKTRRALQIAHDFFGPDLAGLEVLDLGALEGGLSLEFAAQGARVLCVEGRKQSLTKAQFAAEALALTQIDFICGDVRSLDLGDRRFDLVLCYGLLYHLDGPSAVALVRKMEQWTKRLLILDTHFSVTGKETLELAGGHTYRGQSFREHGQGESAEERATKLWASLDDEISFWLTKPSLLNLLNEAGFTTVYEVASPVVYDYWDRNSEILHKYRDRSVFVAVKSVAAEVRTSPLVNHVPLRAVPENIEELLENFPSS